MKCDRCGKDTDTTIMSMFNMDIICMACKEKERAIPGYEQAREEERRQVLAGNYNFEGVGMP